MNSDLEVPGSFLPDLSQPEVRLDSPSPLIEGLEMCLFLGLLPVLAGILGFLVSLGSSAILWGLPLVVIFGALRSGTDCFYQLDNHARQLTYQRSFLGLEKSEHMASYEEIHIVTVRGQSVEIEPGERSWTYAVVFLLQDGTSIQVSSARTDLTAQNQLAGVLAKHLGAILIPGCKEQVLDQVPECKLPEVIRSECRRGAAAEHLLGDGLFTTCFGYLLCLPAIWWTGPMALASLSGLWGGAESLTSAIGALLLLLLSLFPSAPVLVTGLQMMVRSLGETPTKGESEALESEGFERGFDVFANLLVINLVVWVAAYLGSVTGSIGALLSGPLVAASLGGGNLLFLVGGYLGHLPLFGQVSSPALTEPVLLRLSSRLERSSTRCGYCGTAVPGAVAVACNRCESIHHQECWEEFGRCTTFGCGGESCSELSS